MNREILFKAKRKDNGEWVEGQYVYITNPLTEDGKPIKHLICNGTNIFNDLIDPDTLCQYTGLTDKNGKKIWENDIIKTSRYGKNDGKGSNFAGFDIFSVQWDDGGFALYSKWRRFNLRDNNEYEVIGNIFDNPELLEVA